MRNELKIVHDATDMLMKDGFEMEEKLRKLKESNEYQIKIGRFMPPLLF